MSEENLNCHESLSIGRSRAYLIEDFYFYLFIFCPLCYCDIFSFSYNLEHYEASCLLSLNSYGGIELVKLFKKHIDFDFVHSSNVLSDVNLVIDYHVKNKIENVLTKFVYELTKNEKIGEFLKDKEPVFFKPSKVIENLDEYISNKLSTPIITIIETILEEKSDIKLTETYTESEFCFKINENENLNESIKSENKVEIDDNILDIANEIVNKHKKNKKNKKKKFNKNVSKYILEDLDEFDSDFEEYNNKYIDSALIKQKSISALFYCLSILNKIFKTKLSKHKMKTILLLENLILNSNDLEDIIKQFIIK